MAPQYVIAVDLGQVNDPTAIAVLERREQWTGRHQLVANIAAFTDNFTDQPRYYHAPQTAGFYTIIHLERLALGTAYTEIPGRLHTIEQRLRQLWVDALFEETGVGRSQLGDAPVEIVIDATGVGRPVVDLLREAGIDLIAITITGGDQVTRVSQGEYRVPKRDLVGAVQSAMQARRLRAAESLPDWPVLKGELTNFKAKISLAGHDSYGAGADWREGNHDDLVLSVALGIWCAEQLTPLAKAATFQEIVAAWNG